MLEQLQRRTPRPIPLLAAEVKVKVAGLIDPASPTSGRTCSPWRQSRGGIGMPTSSAPLHAKRRCRCPPASADELFAEVRRPRCEMSRSRRAQPAERVRRGSLGGERAEVRHRVRRRAGRSRAASRSPQARGGGQPLKTDPRSHPRRRQSPSAGTMLQASSTRHASMGQRLKSRRPPWPLPRGFSETRPEGETRKGRS